jgi:hypothetical protein
MQIFYMLVFVLMSVIIWMYAPGNADALAAGIVTNGHDAAAPARPAKRIEGFKYGNGTKAT